MAENKMNDAVTNMMDNLDRKVLRDLQVRLCVFYCVSLWSSMYADTNTSLRWDNNIIDLQKGGYVCSAKCFDNKNWSTEQLQQCVERCQMPMQQVQNYLQQEIQSFQHRLQRCAMDCQDRARDNLPASGQPSESQMANAQKGMEKCVTGCVDSHIKILPTLYQRVEEAVKQVKQQ